VIFRQLLDSVSCTYTYLLAGRPGGEALIIDPVIEKVDRYLELLKELDLTLVKAIDTHVHADHITGIGALRDATHCVTVMGKESKVDMVSMRVDDGDKVEIENISLDVMYTPGHTDDSYCFAMKDQVFTGDTLLIRGTGRTDFQNGDPRAAYDSLFNKLLTLPDETLVYPGHDYKGDTVSTIGEEKAFNPRLQVASAEEYADIMDSLILPDPTKMDVAVPASGSVIRKPCSSICARKANGSATASSPVRCTRPISTFAKTSSRAACWRRSRRTRTRSFCSIAPTASARPWPIPKCTRPGWSTPATWPAASTPGSRPAGPWSTPPSGPPRVEPRRR